MSKADGGNKILSPFCKCVGVRWAGEVSECICSKYRCIGFMMTECRVCFSLFTTTTYVPLSELYPHMRHCSNGIALQNAEESFLCLLQSPNHSFRSFLIIRECWIINNDTTSKQQERAVWLMQTINGTPNARLVPHVVFFLPCSFFFLDKNVNNVSSHSLHHTK